MITRARTPHIFAVGGAHMDRRGRMDTEFVPGASIPGSMREEVGGGTFNALRTAVHRGARATLMSVRGGDGAGLRVAEAMAAHGIRDASAVFLDRSTPSYTALLDMNGDVVAALADMGLYDVAFPKQMRRAKIRDELQTADALLTDANLPAAALTRLVARCGARPGFAIAISPAKAIRLAPVLSSLACLFMNRREADAIVAAVEPGVQDTTSCDDADKQVADLRRRGLRRAVISDGANAVTFFDETGIWSLAPPTPRRIVDVTGAGDAMAGGTIAALLAGERFVDAVREGLAVALLTVETGNAVATFTRAEFAEALAMVAKESLNSEGRMSTAS